MFSLWSPADAVVMFYTSAEKEQCFPTLWGTFSTDLGVSPVYQVKTPERERRLETHTKNSVYWERWGEKKGLFIVISIHTFFILLLLLLLHRDKSAFNTDKVQLWGLDLGYFHLEILHFSSDKTSWCQL